jgi:LmbE family N-acetylglucosaminyl deacetylase
MTTYDVSPLGTTLLVWAHPDDETYLAGGLAAMLTDRGQRVACVTATRGEAGGPDQSPDARKELARVRTLELDDALEVLGVDEHYWLDHEDGGCASVDPDHAAGQVLRIVRQVAPDTVVTFGPDGVTGHPDHRAVGRWVDLAVARLDHAPTVLHPVTTPELRAVDPALDTDFGVFELGLPRFCSPDEIELQLPLTGELLDRKVRALLAQPSQTSGLVGAVGLDRFRAWVATETFASPLV